MANQRSSEILRLEGLLEEQKNKISKMNSKALNLRKITSTLNTRQGRSALNEQLEILEIAIEKAKEEEDNIHAQLEVATVMNTVADDPEDTIG